MCWPTLRYWNTQTKGKLKRLEYLQEQLALTGDLDPRTRYQLLQRTTSAVIEAKRFHATKAVMLVHSFSQESKWLKDYQAFARLYGKEATVGELIHVKRVGGIDLYLGWAKGAAQFLTV